MAALKYKINGEILTHIGHDHKNFFFTRQTGLQNKLVLIPYTNYDELDKLEKAE